MSVNELSVPHIDFDSNLSALDLVDPHETHVDVMSAELLVLFLLLVFGVQRKREVAVIAHVCIVLAIVMVFVLCLVKQIQIEILDWTTIVLFVFEQVQIFGAQHTPKLLRIAVVAFIFEIRLILDIVAHKVHIQRVNKRRAPLQTSQQRDIRNEAVIAEEGFVSATQLKFVRPPKDGQSISKIHILLLQWLLCLLVNAHKASRRQLLLEKVKLIATLQTNDIRLAVLDFLDQQRPSAAP